MHPLYIVVEYSHLNEESVVVGVFNLEGLYFRFELSDTQATKLMRLGHGDHEEFKGDELHTISQRNTLKIQKVKLNEDIVW